MNHSHERSIFLEAIELVDPQLRETYIDRACGENRILYDRVRRLVASHFTDQAVLDRAPDVSSKDPNNQITNLHVPKAPLTSDLTSPAYFPQVSGYRLMELIGEGGFGLVYVAQQDQPVRRRVALKMVKPGMGSKEVIARFEAERQALAMMDHPNIAKVFDAGVTDDGRPYFVMELVRGIPITEFCDKAKWGLVQRLELFEDVCTAVHHAHQKGIIHRDLKPSNILTTLYDEMAVVKVIDFGIAKAIGQTLTDKTIYTRFMAMMGTPLYMSPEQAEMNGLDVDTRSDVYSLGVLLYELLTGTTPFDRQRLESAGFQEMRSIILEEEPPPPSNRLSTMGMQLSTISTARGVEPHRLRLSLKGDLDWIVMKALDKDRTRRYDSAADLVRDVHRYLNGEPIEARPPSSWYRWTKFVRRNRVALTAASAIGVSMLAATGISLYQMSLAVQALHDKDSALQAALVAKQEASQARDSVEQFSKRIVNANQLLASAQLHLEEGDLIRADLAYQQAIDLQPSYYLSWVQRAQMYLRNYDWARAAKDYAQAIQLGASSDAPHWHGALPLLLLFHEDKSARELSSMEWSNIRVQCQTAVLDPSIWQHVRNSVFLDEDASHSEWASLLEHLKKIANLKAPPFRNTRDSRPRPPHFEEDTNGPFSGPPWKFSPEPPPRKPPPPPPMRTPLGGPSNPPMMPRSSGDIENLVRVRGLSMMPSAVKEYLMGLVSLRANRMDDARSYLSRSATDPNWPGTHLASIAMSLVYAVEGNVEQAESQLTLSKPIIEKWIQEFESAALDPNEESEVSIPWFDLLEAILLYRETLRTLHQPDDAWKDRLTNLSNISHKKFTTPTISEDSVEP